VAHARDMDQDSDERQWVVEVVHAARLRRELRATTKVLRRQAEALDRVAAGLRTRAIPERDGARRGGDA